jgi:hypothetical protein
MNAKTEERVKAHGQKLNEHFGTNHEPLQLCRLLRRVEVAAHKESERYCNGEIAGDTFDQRIEFLGKKVALIFYGGLKKEGLTYKVRGDEALAKLKEKGFFINTDPRGYALKVKSELAGKLPQDWGGYGLIAPDLSEEGY